MVSVLFFLIAIVPTIKSGISQIENCTFFYQNYSNNSEELENNNVNVLTDLSGNIVSYNFETGATNSEYFDYTSYPKRYSSDFSNQSSNGSRESDRGIIGNDERYLITNPKQNLYFPTCKMLMYRTNINNPATGTGFLIGPNLLMTAGHCVYNSHDANSVFPDSISLYFGLNGATELEQGENYPYYAKCKIAYISSSFYLESQDNPYNDWAIVELDRNIGYTIGGWYELTKNWYSPNAGVSSWGYPGDKDGGKTMWRTDGSFVGRNDYLYYYNLDTAQGQSGSPCFITNGNNYYACGIHTIGRTNDNGGVIINDLIYNFADSFSHYHNYLHMAAEIIPTDYGFADNYPTDNYTSSNYRSHILNTGFHFQTRRYRTGYIHNEYVVMSSIRRNINSAFIEYMFDVPVVYIKVELAHWRPVDVELLSNQNGTAVIRYLEDPELYDDFTTIFDMISPVDLLPDDRTNPTEFTIYMPTGLTTFQFYTDNNMVNTNDNNRGRICIGNLQVYTTEGI